MRALRMVDLVTQYEKLKPEIDRAVLGVMEAAAFINGPEVQSFQKELEGYMDVEHVIPCANGTDALQIAMMALDLQPGDEVITASFTYIATAEVIALLRLKPVLVEVDPHSFLIDPEAVRKAITPRTRAIVPVHLFGQCAPMDELLSIAHEHGLFVIEDTAQAIGCTHRGAEGARRAGTIGHIGCTSFFPSKNLGCFGDGGALFTRDAALADRIRRIANHGQSQRYYHDDIGVNSRLDSIQAAILRIKLRHLDTYTQARQAAAARYDAAFSGHSGIEIPARVHWSDHVFHQYTLKLTPGVRDGLQAHLNTLGIPSMVYYPVPVHLQKAYVQADAGDRFRNTEQLCAQVISLPMHTELDDEQLDFIIDSTLQYLNQSTPA
ncbi:aminotransferase class I/II-fold pyridoxal phosphate-dependent enzyme [bacterium]|nr:aminotransferase class I/II-fold pyridoxal phosphate-dependent enzyme [bacterium]